MKTELGQDKMNTTVVAFGGNALCPNPFEDGVDTQYRYTEEAMLQLLPLFKNKSNRIYLVHGNGPQVGQELLRQEEASRKIPGLPLDSCVANTQGSIGYLLERAIRNCFEVEKVDRNVAALLSQVEVDPKDPAFQNPSKPIGPFYTRYRARQLTLENGWVLREDSGRGYRMLVPSPKPLRILGLEAAEALANAGFIVIVGGGGGVPIAITPFGGGRGIEAVIDKDFTACLLGTEVQADRLILITSVPEVTIHFGSPDEKALRDISLNDLIHLNEGGHFPAGSMGPKVEAAIRFIQNGGKEVIITSPACIQDALVGKSGTRVLHSLSSP